MAYDNTEYSSYKSEMARHMFTKQCIANHGRNQMSKDQLFLTIKIAGDGTTAYCFYEENVKKSMKIQKDFLNASMDV